MSSSVALPRGLSPDAARQCGLVLNIQRYCVHDGPGIRTTVFLKGCPLNCWWCHNPESQAAAAEITVSESRCVRCGQCAAVCPQGVPSPFLSRMKTAGVTVTVPAEALTPALSQREREGVKTRPQRDEIEEPAGARCTHCGACVAACPSGARQDLGRRMTVPEVLEEVLRDRVFYDESGGGVTLSGGEPLLQGEFVAALLQACRAADLHTALDTCGFAPRETLLGLAPWVDLFLYDLKAWDDAVHRQHTGVSNAAILDNLAALAATHDNIWVRVPVIPGINDAADQWEAAAGFVASLPGVRQVNLLPYHALGTHKAFRGETAAAPRDVAPVDPLRLECAANIFRAAGLHTRIGG